VTLFRSIGGAIGVALFGAVFTHMLQSGLMDRLPEGANLPRSLDPTAIHHLPETLSWIILMPSARLSTPCSCWPRALWCWHLRCRGFYVKRRCAKGMSDVLRRWRYAYRAYNYHSRRPGKRSATRQKPYITYPSY
jgi:hypothetical protein